MSLLQWSDFYKQIEAGRMRELAEQIVVVHSTKDPNRVRDQFLRAARRIEGNQEQPIGADPMRLRTLVSGIPGVKVETVPKE